MSGGGTTHPRFASGGRLDACLGQDETDRSGAASPRTLPIPSIRRSTDGPRPRVRRLCSATNRIVSAVKSGAPFAVPGLVARTLGINGKDAPSVRMRIGIALRQVLTSAFCESARLHPGGSSSPSLVQSPSRSRRTRRSRTTAMPRTRSSGRAAWLTTPLARFRSSALAAALSAPCSKPGRIRCRPGRHRCPRCRFRRLTERHPF